MRVYLVEAFVGLFVNWNFVITKCMHVVLACLFTYMDEVHAYCVCLSVKVCVLGACMLCRHGHECMFTRYMRVVSACS